MLTMRNIETADPHQLRIDIESCMKEGCKARDKMIDFSGDESN